MHESFLKDVLDSTKVGIFLLDRTFQVIWINRAIEELFGIQKEEVIGKYKPSLIEHTLKNIFEDPEEFASRVIATYKQNDYVENFVCHILPGPGRKERWVEHWSQPIYEGMYAGGRIEQYYDITALKKVQDRLAMQIKEKELLLREVHHRIKNNIASISSLVSLKAQATSNRETAMELMETKNLLDSMVGVYEKLIHSDDYQKIPFKQYVEELLTSIVKTFHQSPSIRIETHIKDVPLDSRRIMWIGMILNELVTNALKYAFQGRNQGLVTVSIDAVEQKGIVTVKDNGIGLSKGIPGKVKEGFGFMLVQLLTEQLHGTLHIEGVQGTTVTIAFPL